MSRQAKRPRRIAENVKDDVPMDPSDSVEEVSAGPDSLPDEMLLKVFSYLEHGDVLCSRLVNKRWCSVISSSMRFKNSVVYLVKGEDKKSKTNKGIETLKLSSSCWPHIRFAECGRSEESYAVFRVPETVANSVVSVEILECSWTWKFLKSIIIMFSNLNAVSIKWSSFYDQYEDCKAPLGKQVTRSDKQVQDKWSTLVPKIRSLTLDFGYYRDVARIITYEFHGLKEMVSLKLAGSVHSNYYQDEPGPAVLDVLHQIIFSSQENLKTLVLILPDNVTELLLPKLTELVCESNVDRNRCLNLVRVDLGNFNRRPPRDILNILKMVQSLVCTQRNLVHCTLPPLYGEGLIEQQELVKKLPQNLRFLQVLDQDYAFPNFLDLFPDLCHLEIDNQILPHVVTGGKKYLKMRHMKTYDGLGSAFVPGLVTAFPNLTVLDLRMLYDFGDRALQDIIKNLKMLESLSLQVHYESYITDYGVTGIQIDYCERLFHTREIFHVHSHEVPAQHVTGKPLCSLKRLKKLSISSSFCISDVGIVFGFGFNELRSLQLHLGKKVTNWGLDYLRRLNPNLEEIQLEVYSRNSVSPDGLNGILKKLPRVKDHHQHLRLLPLAFLDQQL